MSNTPVSSAVTDGVMAFVKAQVPAGILVGDGKAPSDSVEPYMVLYRIAAGEGQIGGFGAPEDMRRFKFQLSAVGSQRDQVESLLDRVVERFAERSVSGEFAYPLTVVGHQVVDRELSTDLGLSSEGVFSSSQHLRVMVTRAS